MKLSNALSRWGYSKEEWEHERAKGRNRYVLTRGAWIGGLLFLNELFWSFVVAHRPVTAREAAVDVFFSVLVGYAGGLLVWHSLERRYPST